MASSVGFTNVVTGAKAHATSVPAVTPTPSTAAATSKTTTQAVSISPRIIDDPTAGIITQYLDSTGKVANQFPSTTVVAYLRAGLTSEGLSRHTLNGAESKAAGTFA